MPSKGKGWKWNPEKFLIKVKKANHKGLDRAAIFLSNYIVGSFGDSGQPGGKSGATRQQRASNRSKPWGPPNIDSGHLRRNIGYDITPGRPSSRRVGTSIGGKASVGYAMWLEFGTRRMLPRPFLRPAVAKNRRTLARRIAQKVREWKNCSEL